MYGYNEYFDAKKQDLPYRSAFEELEDYLRLLDMLLESYLEYKGLGKEEKLFSRGLVITESEMQSYFDKPPYFRERDLCDPELAADAEAAFEYIGRRVEKTLYPFVTEDGETVLSDDDDDEWTAPEGLLAAPDGEFPDEESGDEALADRETGNAAVTEDESGDGADAEGESGKAGFTDEEFGDEAFADEESGDNVSEIGILWMETLKNIFGLDRKGVMAVTLTLASSLDRRYDRIFGFLQDDITKTRPTAGLLDALMARITPREGAEELAEESLDEDLFTVLFVNSEDNRGLDTELVLNPLLKRIMMGMPDREELMPEALTLYSEDPDIPLFFRQSAEELVYVLEGTGTPFCYIENKDEDTVLHLMFWYASATGVPMFVMDLSQLMRQSYRERSACLADAALRLRLSNGLLCIRMDTGEGREAGLDKEFSAKRWKLLNRIYRICRCGCIILFGEEKEPGELIVRSVPFLKVEAPDVDIRTDIWDYFLHAGEEFGIAEDIVVEDLADCYDISFGMIRNICSHAKAAAGTRRLERLDREMILESLMQLNQTDFSGLASQMKAVYTWDDIKLTEDQKKLLKVACDRYRLRNRVGRGWGMTRKNAYGNGVSLLLYGPPGTGKTMAAQVVANELGIPLYRVDISQIFSKYIGETEKNLSIIFEAAKGSNVILFFDEADALFSKRTEINNSNDKYANSETAFLLQKIEEYDGMSILATNLYTNFDTAFVRRITYAVRLDSPDAEARYILWTTTLPQQAKLEEGLPFRFLARQFELSGANIKAILYSAAYMAGAEGKPVGMGHIVRAMEYEYRKLGRFIDREAFGPYAKYLSVTGKNDTDKYEAIK